MSRSKMEQETIIRWDRESPDALVFTASSGQKRKWERRGYAMEPYGGGWLAKVPIRAVSFRRIPFVKRPGPKRAAGLA